MLIDLPLSGETGELENTIKKLKQEYVKLWWETGSAVPEFFKSYTPKEQDEIEKNKPQNIRRMRSRE